MKVLELTTSLENFDDVLVFTESALLARPEAKHLAVELTALLEGLDALALERRKARRAAVRAQAMAVMADRNIEGVIKKLQSAALALTEQKRDVPWFAILFSATLTELTRPALTRQITIGEELLERLSDPGVPESLKATFEPLLKDVIEKGKGVDAERKAIKRDQRNLRAKEAAFKEKINQTRTSVYGQLLQLPGGKGEAETFFRSPAKIEADEEDEGGEGGGTPG